MDHFRTGLDQLKSDQVWFIERFELIAASLKRPVPNPLRFHRHHPRGPVTGKLAAPYFRPARELHFLFVYIHAHLIYPPLCRECSIIVMIFLISEGKCMDEYMKITLTQITISIYILGENILLLRMYETNVKFWKKFIIFLCYNIFKMLQKRYSISKTK